MTHFRFLFIGLVLTAAFQGGMRAQETKTVYTDASVFPIYGKAVSNTSATYERLPAAFEGVIRKPVWNLGRNSSGISIRFRSNSTSVRVRWISSGLNTMNHMTDTGTRGLDLYAREPGSGKWRFVKSARPQRDTLNDQLIINNMEPTMREYILYLSLYEGVRKVEIGVDEGAVLDQPALDSPRQGSPVVMYGTSILQGGCANRPGMAFTNILSRELDREVINLGFSGNAHLDEEIASLMAQVENPAVFVLDNVPNCKAEIIDKRQERFFRILRTAHPDVPVVFIENPNYPHAVFDKDRAQDIAARNASLKAVYDKLKKAGEKKIYYIKGDTMLGTDGEATVDGTHFTDLGMVRYTEYVLPTLRKALKAAPAPGSEVLGARRDIPLKVGTYNIEGPSATRENHIGYWPNRRESAMALLTKADFDIFGTQENSREMLGDIVKALPQYKWIGSFRSKSPSVNAILYKTDRFTLMESGHFYYSPTPEIDFSYDPDDTGKKDLNCIWGKFFDKETGVTFFLFNSHIHAFYPAGEAGVMRDTLRCRDARILKAKVAEIAGDAYVICTGDFNSSEAIYNNETGALVRDDSPGYKELTKGGMLLDVKNLTENRKNERENSCPSWKGTGPSPISRKLDHIFLSSHASEPFTVTAYEVITDSFEMVHRGTTTADGVKNGDKFISNCSDHRPVTATILFK